MASVRRVYVAITPATVLCILLLAAPIVLTQGRFQVESRDVLSQSSLVIYTIRDSQLSTCYTLFVVEPAPPPAPVFVVEPPRAAPEPILTSTEPAPAANNVAKARAARDEQMAALRVRVAARTPPGDRLSYYASAYDDEAARRKIDDTYDDAVRGTTIGRLPWAVPFPGMPTGGEPSQAEAQQRGTIEPTSDRRAADSGPLLESWLMQAAQAPRIAATGPVPCKPSVVKDSKP
jgi:hypothetical protein